MISIFSDWNDKDNRRNWRWSETPDRVNIENRSEENHSNKELKSIDRERKSSRTHSRSYDERKLRNHSRSRSKSRKSSEKRKSRSGNRSKKKYRNRK